MNKSNIFKIKILKDYEAGRAGEIKEAKFPAGDEQEYVDNGFIEILKEDIPKKERQIKKQEAEFQKWVGVIERHPEVYSGETNDLTTIPKDIIPKLAEKFDFVKTYFKKQNQQEEIKEILKRPTLFNDICLTEFDKKIVGELESRKVIFLCGAGGRLVENCQIASYNVLVNDEAGSGKDYVTGKVLSILPKEVYIHKTRISPTIFTYWHNSEKEPEWTWDGKVFYPEDISEVVLNSDVFKVMASGGSSASIVIKQVAIDLIIKGKPVIITTTATATPSPELTRRFVILNLDSSEEQTRAIMKRHCEFAKTGIVPEYNKQYTEAMRYLKRIKVRIPFGDLLSEVLPSKSIIMRTHLPRFLDYIKASASFHQYQREEEEDFILAQGEDYDLARECFLKLCSNKFMIPLTINQKTILEIFSKNPTQKFSNSQFHSEHNFISERAMLTNLGLLSKYGILESSSGKDDYGRELTLYSLSKSYNPNDKFNLPKFKDLVRFASVSSECSSASVSSVSSAGGGSEATEDAEAVYCGIQSAKTPNPPCPKCSGETELKKSTHGERYYCLNYAYCGGFI